MQKLFIRVQATLWRRFAPVVVQRNYIHEYFHKCHLLVGKKNICKEGADGRWFQQLSSFLHPQPPPQIPSSHMALKFLPCGHVVWIFPHDSSPTLLKCTSLTNRSRKADSLGPVSLGFHPWPSLHHRDALHEIWERDRRRSLCLCCLFILTSTAVENVGFSVAEIRKAPESGP